MTLGMLEEDILSNLNATIQSIMERERQVRNSLCKNNRLELEDIVFRSYGILLNARKLSTEECMEHFSNLKLGISLGWLPQLTQDKCNKLITDVQSASLQQTAGHELDVKERDALRATTIRNILAN